MSQTDLIGRIEKALDEVRPFLRSDGGDISLVGLDENSNVRVQLHGNCIGCKVNQMTLKNGVEMTIRKFAPEVGTVTEVHTEAKGV
jgi:Fe-S cluster biogenesis protein NfuA